jgi:hypothetical protein
MKKIYSFALIIVFIIVGMTGCNKDKQKAGHDESFSATVKGTHQDEIHRIFGEPSGTLSGFWGDIYKLDNGTQIIMYYDENGVVEQLTVTDEEGTKTLNME